MKTLIIGVMLAGAAASCLWQPEAPPAHVTRNPAISENEWERYGHAAIPIGDKIYVIGGIDLRGDHKAIARVDCYDAKKREWSVAASIPTPRVFAGVAALDGRIHVVGGISDEDQRARRDSSVHECYDPSTNAWTTLAPLPSPRSRLVVAGASGKLYAIGGMETVEGESRDIAAVSVYDPKAQSWSTGPAMPTARHAHAAVGVDNRIFVIGGYSLKQTLEPLSSCDVLDTATGKWTSGPAMNVHRSWFGACILNGCIIAIGGGDHPETLCPPFEKWTSLDIPDINDRRFAVAPAQNEILVMGGETDGEWLRVIRVSDMPSQSGE